MAVRESESECPCDKGASCIRHVTKGRRCKRTAGPCVNVNCTYTVFWPCGATIRFSSTEPATSKVQTGVCHSRRKSFSQRRQSESSRPSTYSAPDNKTVCPPCSTA